MFKNLKVLFLSLIFGLILTTPVYAQEEATPEENVVIATQEETVSDLVVTIYVDENCPHCKIVEEFVVKYGLEGSVIYKQLSGNDENFEALTALWEELDVSDQEQGWPFMTYEVDGEKSYKVGDSPIIEFLVDEYQIEVDKSDVEEDTSSGSNSGLLLLGGFFFFAIIGYVIYSMVIDKKE